MGNCGAKIPNTNQPCGKQSCEASIKQQHQSWNRVMHQPKENGTHQAMATIMKQHEEVSLLSKSAAIQHKLMTTYIMTQQSNLSDRDHMLMPQLLKRALPWSQALFVFTRVARNEFLWREGVTVSVWLACIRLSWSSRLFPFAGRAYLL